MVEEISSFYFSSSSTHIEKSVALYLLNRRNLAVIHYQLCPKKFELN